MDLKQIVKRWKEKGVRKDQILIVFLIGVLLMIIAVPAKEKGEEPEGVYEASELVSPSDSLEYAEYLEVQLENILSKMEGAGEVACMVTLSTSAEQVIEKDMEVSDEIISEADSQGGERATTQSSRTETTIYDNQENGTPYVSKELSPKVEGVVVIADGGDNAVVVKNITESVQALFGIESHKIRIVKKGGIAE